MSGFFRCAERVVARSRIENRHILLEQRDSGLPLSGYLIAWYYPLTKSIQRLVLGIKYNVEHGIYD